MSLATFIKEQQVAAPIRAATFATAHRLLNEVNQVFYPTAHFLERFNLRAVSPLAATRSFDTVVRSTRHNIDRIIGKKAAFKVGEYVFVIDATQPGYVRAVTFWRTDAPAEQALAGRGDVLFQC